MSIVLALSSAVFASMTAILAKVGMKDVDSDLATAVRTIVVLAVSAVVVSVSGQWGDLSGMSGKSVLYLTLSGLSTGGSWLFYFKALQRGEVSVIAPLAKSGVIFTLLFSFLILNEPLAPFVICGGVLVCTGTIVVSLKKRGKGEGSPARTIVFALLSAVLAAATTILAKLGIEENIRANAATFFRTAIILVFSWIFVLAAGKQKGLPSVTKKNYLFLLLSGLATGASWLCYFGAIELGEVSRVAPIDKLSVVLTMLLGILLFREKPRWTTLCGGVLIATGTVFLIL